VWLSTCVCVCVCMRISCIVGTISSMFVCVCVRPYHSSVVMCAYVRTASICACVCVCVSSCVHIYICFLRFFFPSPPCLLFFFSHQASFRRLPLCVKNVWFYFLYFRIYIHVYVVAVVVAVASPCVYVCVSLSVHFLLVNILIVTFISCFPFGSNFSMRSNEKTYLYF